MSKSTLLGISLTELALQPNPDVFEVSDTVQQTLARAMGFDPVNNLWRTIPIVKLPATQLSFPSALVVANIPYVKYNTNFYIDAPSPIHKIVTITGLANNGAFDIWTPTSGMCPVISQLNITPTQTGVFQFFFGATLIAQQRFTLNSTASLPLPRIALTWPTKDVPLTIKNTSGSASDIIVVMHGLEVTE